MGGVICHNSTHNSEREATVKQKEAKEKIVTQELKHGLLR